MNKELTLLEPTTAIDVYSSPEGLNVYIEQAREFVRDTDADVSTDKGRKAIASTAHKVSKLKVALDNMGKELTADWKAKAKTVDDSRKAMRDQLDELRDEARAPLTEWENAEKERKQELDDKYAELENAIQPVMYQSRTELEATGEYAVHCAGFDYQEYQSGADMLVSQLQQAIKSRTDQLDIAEAEDRKAEERRKEQERIEAEQRAEAERLEQQRIEQERIEQERQAKIDAEAEKLRIEREAIEREKVEAAERVRVAEEEAAQVKADAEAAAQRERDRIKDEQVEAERLAAKEKQRIAEEKAAIAAEEKAKAAAIARRESVQSELADGLTNYCKSKTKAKELVTAIDRGYFDRLSINYADVTEEDAA